MLLTKFVKIKWLKATKKYYESKGYKFTKYDDEFEVTIKDVPSGSTAVSVELLCDYCLEEGKKTIITQLVNTYYRNNINGIIHKDCCSECRLKKIKESNQLKYGVDHVSQLESTKQKAKETNIKRYGVDNVLKLSAIHEKAMKSIENNREVIAKKREKTMIEKYGVKNIMHLEATKNKIKNTNLNKYGVEHAFQNKEIQERFRNTMVKKYGVAYSLQSKEIKEKVKETVLKKYGVEYIMQSEDMKRKANITNLKKHGVKWNTERNDVKKKMRQTMYKHGTQKCSKQQKRIHNLIGGKLNYPEGYLSLDIALLEDKIYIEYDGGGHDLSVKLGGISEKDFHIKEIKRYYYLKGRGWKEIKIICSSDKLPSDSNIIELINKAKIYLKNSNHTYFEINFDNKIIWCKEYNINIAI